MEMCICTNPIINRVKHDDPYCERCEHWWDPKYGSKEPKKPFIEVKIGRPALTQHPPGQPLPPADKEATMDNPQRQRQPPPRRLPRPRPPQQARKPRWVPGRNDPCICGSGLKFKKCCINRIGLV